MKVNELIECLKEFPPEAEVIYAFHSEYAILHKDEIFFSPKEKEEYFIHGDEVVMRKDRNCEDSDMDTTTLPVYSPAAQLLDVRAVATLLKCSTRHVYRQADAGRMPAPVRIGALVRWRLEGPGGLKEWLDAGCPSCRKEHHDDSGN